jgi:prepilin-type processing-associated H-X9-DG protein
MAMYIQDYDETTPAVVHLRTGNNEDDFYAILQPYIKNITMFYCPDRTEWTMPTGDDCSGQEGINPQQRCIGYGYNWGILSAVRLGLIGNRIHVPSPSPVSYIEPGIALASIVAPADTFVYGDTGDNPRYTICSNYIFQYYINDTKNSQLRHGGRLNVDFVDGHAKSVNYKAGLFPALNGNSPMGLPKSQADQVKYCANPDATYTAGGMTLSCRDWVNWVNTNTTWFGD